MDEVSYSSLVKLLSGAFRMEEAEKLLSEFSNEFSDPLVYVDMSRAYILMKLFGKAKPHLESAERLLKSDVVDKFSMYHSATAADSKRVPYRFLEHRRNEAKKEWQFLLSIYEAGCRNKQRNENAVTPGVRSQHHCEILAAPDEVQKHDVAVRYSSENVGLQQTDEMLLGMECHDGVNDITVERRGELLAAMSRVLYFVAEEKFATFGSDSESDEEDVDEEDVNTKNVYCQSNGTSSSNIDNNNNNNIMTCTAHDRDGSQHADGRRKRKNIIEQRSGEEIWCKIVKSLDGFGAASLLFWNKLRKPQSGSHKVDKIVKRRKLSQSRHFSHRMTLLGKYLFGKALRIVEMAKHDNTSSSSSSSGIGATLAEQQGVGDITFREADCSAAGGLSPTWIDFHPTAVKGGRVRLEMGEVFGTDGNVVTDEEDTHLSIELCSGSGHWIFQRARAEPHKRWVAMELRHDRCNQILSKCIALDVRNLCILGGDASVTLHLIPHNSAMEVFISFPEPPVTADLDQLDDDTSNNKDHWMNEDLFVCISRILRSRGRLCILTDHYSFFLQLASIFKALPTVYRLSYSGQIRQSQLPVEFRDESYFDCLWKNGGRLDRYLIEAEKLSMPL